MTNNVSRKAYSFIYVAMLQLHKSGTDSGNITLLIGEGHSTSTLNVKQNVIYQKLNSGSLSVAVAICSIFVIFHMHAL